MSYDFNHQEENLEMNTKGYEDLNTTSSRTEQRALDFKSIQEQLEKISSILLELKESELIETERRASLEKESAIKLQSLARGFIARQKQCFNQEYGSIAAKSDISLEQVLLITSTMMKDEITFGIFKTEYCHDKHDGPVFSDSNILFDLINHATGIGQRKYEYSNLLELLYSEYEFSDLAA